MSKYSIPIDEKDVYKISEESAINEVKRILENYEIDPARADPEQEKVIDEFLDRVMLAFRRGDFEIKQDESKGFCIIQKIKKGEPLIYREFLGKDRIALESFPVDKVYSRAYALLGRLSGFGEDVIKGLDGKDWKNAEALAMLFFLY